MTVLPILLFIEGCGESDSAIPKESETPTSENRNPTSSSLASDAVVVATVGPLKIHRGEVLKFTEHLEKGARLAREGESLEEVRKNIRKRGLQSMIDRRLLVLGSAQHPEWVTDASWEIEVQHQLTEMGADEVERRRQLAGLPKEEFFEQFTSKGLLTENDVSDLFVLLEKLLGRLNDKDKMAFVLREMEGLSYAEVAQAMKTTEVAVRIRISRSKKKLQKELEEILLSGKRVGHD